MHSIKIANLDINEVIGFTSKLKQDGLVQGRDFDFAYHPSVYDAMTGNTDPRYTEFRFYHEHHAVFYSLKWSST